MFYFFLGPEMYRHAAACGGFWFGNFSCGDITTQSYCTNPKTLGGLPSGESLHSDTSYHIASKKQVEKCFRTIH